MAKARKTIGLTYNDLISPVFMVLQALGGNARQRYERLRSGRTQPSSSYGRNGDFCHLVWF